jgi:hypothetical protein
LDLSSTSNSFRLEAIHLLIKLADRSGQFPRYMHLEDVKLVPDRQFHRHGGFADVYQGIHNGQLIAVKKPRLLGDLEIAQKVFRLSASFVNIF